MNQKQYNIQEVSIDSTLSRDKACSFKINEGLFKRMEAHVKSQYSRVRSKTDLVEMAILEFLNREEPIAEKLKEVRFNLETQI